MPSVLPHICYLVQHAKQFAQPVQSPRYSRNTATLPARNSSPTPASALALAPSPLGPVGPDLEAAPSPSSSPPPPSLLPYIATYQYQPQSLHHHPGYTGLTSLLNLVTISNTFPMAPALGYRVGYPGPEPVIYPMRREHQHCQHRTRTRGVVFACPQPGSIATTHLAPILISLQRPSGESA